MAEKQPLPAPEEWDSAPFSSALSALSALSGQSEVEGVGYASWHATLQGKYDLHQCVRDALKYKPLDYLKLAMEYPHAADADPTRIAYTRSAADGCADRQLITSVGKYLARHWPHVSDHIRRDIQALFTPDVMKFVYTMPEIIAGIEFGPRSCMASIAGYFENRFDADDRAQLQTWLADPTTDEPEWSKHPYSSYHPKFGWHMALRTHANGTINGRALCLTHKGEDIFVRTYRRHATDPLGWSDRDFALEAYLISQKYALATSWPQGARLAIRAADGGIYAPYMDGGSRRVREVDYGVFEIHSGGDFCCESTSGFVAELYNEDENEDEDCDDCDECGDRYHPDDLTSIGRHGEQGVCCHCLDNCFQLVTGRDGRNSTMEYYIRDEDACSTVDDSGCFDSEYLPHYIVRLKIGNYAHQDNCVQINGDYYLDDDADVVTLAEENPRNGDCHGLLDDCYGAGDGTWWASRDHYLEHNPPEESDDVQQHDALSTV